jgi:multidrug efflux pump subunit AcrB
MASFTTVLGMIPLLTDRLYSPMAATIMFGLSFATVLTLIVVPVLYSVFFRITPDNGPCETERRTSNA